MYNFKDYILEDIHHAVDLSHLTHDHTRKLHELGEELFSEYIESHLQVSLEELLESGLHLKEDFKCIIRGNETWYYHKGEVILYCEWDALRGSRWVAVWKEE